MKITQEAIDTINERLRKMKLNSTVTSHIHDSIHIDIARGEQRFIFVINTIVQEVLMPLNSPWVLP
jgi:hypothetical protein